MCHSTENVDIPVVAIEEDVDEVEVEIVSQEADGALAAVSSATTSLLHPPPKFSPCFPFFLVVFRLLFEFLE